MPEYIHQQPGWPTFIWNNDIIAEKLPSTRYKQGYISGQMAVLGFAALQDNAWRTLSNEVANSSAIEGIALDLEKVRSSVARRLGLKREGGDLIFSHYIEGAVQVVLDATQNYNDPLTKERLWGWHTALFPGGMSDFRSIEVGRWRLDSAGPMQVVSGAVGHERVHYEAPSARNLDDEMDRFLAWFNAESPCDMVIKAAIAHLWFVMVHPFEDGNGRIARAITDMLLARSENTSLRFYSVSTQILSQRDEYYRTLDKVGRGTLEITQYLLWFIKCIDSALEGVDKILHEVMARKYFWDNIKGIQLNKRQKYVLEMLLDNFEGALTNQKWAKLTKSSHDTALRDINDLLQKNILVKIGPPTGRGTKYAMNQILFNQQHED